jgi:hypothetical protein
MRIAGLLLATLVLALLISAGCSSKGIDIGHAKTLPSLSEEELPKMMGGGATGAPSGVPGKGGRKPSGPASSAPGAVP